MFKADIFPDAIYRRLSSMRIDKTLCLGVESSVTKQTIKYILTGTKLQHQDYYEEYLPHVFVHEKEINMFKVVNYICIYVYIFWMQRFKTYK